MKAKLLKLLRKDSRRVIKGNIYKNEIDGGYEVKIVRKRLCLQNTFNKGYDRETALKILSHHLYDFRQSYILETLELLKQ